MHVTKLRVSIVASAALLIPRMAAADDILIDPAKVSDASTYFMVKITEPGHYRLTGNLVVPNADTTAIEINADDVEIDLGGFAVRGPSSCSSAPVTCKPSGPGNGVHAVWRHNIVVKNGTISGMGNVGIYLEMNTAHVEKVRVEHNAGGGVVLFGGTLSNSVVQGNGNDGLIGLDTQVQRSIIRGNQGYGFKAYGESSYAHTSFSGNNNSQEQLRGKPKSGGGNSCGKTPCP
jgi:hypothetical protein